MYRLTDKNITKNQIDSWAGNNRSSWNLHFKYTAALEESQIKKERKQLQKKLEGK